jgi:hypothetical protein
MWISTEQVFHLSISQLHFQMHHSTTNNHDVALTHNLIQLRPRLKQ